VRRSRGEVYIGHGRLCVCLSVPRRIPTCTDPDIGLSCGMVDLFVQSVNGFRCYNNRAEREMSASACKPTLGTVFRDRFPADGFGYDI